MGGRAQDRGDAFEDFLTWIVGALDRSGIPYMLTGGAAVGFWGIIRTTLDADVVIEIRESQVDALVSRLAEDAYVDPATAREAVRARAPFNAIHTASGWKADLIPLRDAPYAQESFRRRVRLSYGEGGTIWVISPEDLILSKLSWSRSAGGSERQEVDIAGILRLNRSGLDGDYLRRWASVLGVADDLRRIEGTAAS